MATTNNSRDPYCLLHVAHVNIIIPAKVFFNTEICHGKVSRNGNIIFNMKVLCTTVGSCKQQASAQTQLLSETDISDSRTRRQGVLSLHSIPCLSLISRFHSTFPFQPGGRLVLDILVENAGRINYDTPMEVRKGKKNIDFSV